MVSTQGPLLSSCVEFWCGWGDGDAVYIFSGTSGARNRYDILAYQMRLLVFLALSGACLSAETVPSEKYTPTERRHWAFQKRATPVVPAIANAKPIDAFILARLQKEGFRPAPPADRATLIRRVYFDLIGLPPSPAEVRAFVADQSPQAYEHLI